MKKYIVLLFSLLLITNISFGQSGWVWLNPYPTGNNVNSISFCNNGNIESIVAVCDGGMILKSDNSGNYWYNQISNLEPFNSIRDVRFFNKDKGILLGGSNIGGGSGFIKYTTNGGNNWNSSSAPNYNWYKLFVLDSTVQFAVGDYYVVKSLNGGVSWTSLNSQGSYLRGVSFINNNTGIVVGYMYVPSNPYYYTRSLILKTTDAGNTWKADSVGNGIVLNDVAFTNSNNVFIVGDNNIVYKSTNAGLNWNSKLLGSSNFTKVRYLDTNRIFLTGVSGLLVKTTNGGVNWTNQSVSTAALRDLTFNNSGTGFIAGDRGLIYKTTDFGLTWTSLTYGIFPTYDWEAFHGVQFIDDNNGTAVGSSMQGRIFHTTNGGLNWSLQNNISCTPTILNDVFFVNAATGFIVGNDNAFLKTTNTGNNWECVFIGYGDFYKIQFINSQTGFIAGYNGIFKTTNTGSSWTQIYQSAGNHINDIFFADSSFGIAVGTGQAGGTILCTTNVGETWLTRNSGVNFYTSLNGVWLTSDSTAIIADRDGRILKSTNYGNTWRIVNSSTYTLNSVCFKNTLNGVVVCNSGIILQTTNGGENWYNAQSNCSSNLLRCARRGPNDYVVVGNYLSVLSTAGISPVGIEISSSEVPTKFILHQNYPNPFNPVTKIKFDISKSSLAKIIIYDILGREVATLLNEELKPGTYSVDWDGSNYASGIYFYRLVVGDNTNNGEIFTETKKMLMIK